jgi:molybdopterin-guanine dinucleotide biosynthesis protein MobB
LRTILFFGYSNGGKTTAISHVTRALVRAGFRVGTVKRIHDPNFTIDTPGKDTWKHAQAGASVVVALAEKELTVIKRSAASSETIAQVMKLFRAESIDYVLIEGLSTTLKDKKIPRILCARDEEGVRQFLGKRRLKIDCITGPVTEVHGLEARYRVPIVRLPDELGRFLEIIGVDAKRKGSG